MVLGALLILLGAGWLLRDRTRTSDSADTGRFRTVAGNFGLLANTEDTRKRMLFMHIAVTLGLLGFLATAAAIFQEVQLLQGK